MLKKLLVIFTPDICLSPNHSNWTRRLIIMYILQPHVSFSSFYSLSYIISISYSFDSIKYIYINQNQNQNQSRVLIFYSPYSFYYIYITYLYFQSHSSICAKLGTCILALQFPLLQNNVLLLKYL